MNGDIMIEKIKTIKEFKGLIGKKIVNVGLLEYDTEKQKWIPNKGIITLFLDDNTSIQFSVDDYTEDTLIHIYLKAIL